MLYAMLLAATVAATSMSPGAAGESHGKYLGKPDLALTVQMIEAGGGPAQFSSQKLFAYLAGSKTSAEAKSLTQRYGASNISQFFKTFDRFVHLAVAQVQTQHIALPPAKPAPPAVLANSLYRAGVMPDGRYDVGYMLERLLSRPMHVTLMRNVNDDPAFGAQKNAQFHVILTAAMKDLHKAYGE